MKLRVEVDKSVPEGEIVIRCRELNEAVRRVCTAAENLCDESDRLTVYRDNETVYLPPEEILFFETEREAVYAHTAAELYRTKLRLYELENLLPGTFLRVSKSAILNSGQVRSLSRVISGASLVQFHKSHKQVYVSRHYYRQLRDRLAQRVQPN